MPARVWDARVRLMRVLGLCVDNNSCVGPHGQVHGGAKGELGRAVAWDAKGLRKGQPLLAVPWGRQSFGMWLVAIRAVR